MPITYQKSTRSFFLQGPRSSYALAIEPTQEIPIHWYWGTKIEPADLTFAHIYSDRAFSPATDRSKGNSLDLLPQELPTFGHGDFRIPALSVGQENGSRLLELKFKEHRICSGKPKLIGLPSTYTESDEEADTLELVLIDGLTGVEVSLFYTVFLDFDAVTRSMQVRNGGPKTVTLLHAASCSVDMPKKAYEQIHLPGAWARERHVSRQPVIPGRFCVESVRGATSHQQHSFLALVDPETSETKGDAYGFSLVYSGNFCASIETDQFARPRISMAFHPDLFSWELKSGDSFQTPETVLVYSGKGLGGMSQIYHKLYRTRLARGRYRDQPRPCLINNWEATYFEFDESKLLTLAGSAQKLGIELFVLDDGWFGKRDNDCSSLGDWVVDRRKLPNGIDGLAQKINALGMKFGLWFEPEMISPDSNLYRAHPDWCIHVPERSRTEGRSQLILDLSRDEVCDHIIQALSSVLESAPIEYVKWDMNRHMTETGSLSLPSHRQKESSHRYMLGLYRIIDTLTTRFPNVLFEGCSGGGGRFDPGILHYMPQSWTSDNSDAISRLKIQHGTSLVYPWSSISAHVSIVPNHQHHRVTPLATRFHAALTGSFGYELDLGQLKQEELEAIKDQVAFFKRHRSLLASGTLHRLRDPFTDNQAAWCVVAEDGSEALAVHVHVLTEANEMTENLKLRGLDAGSDYEVSGMERPLRGDVLMNAGLPVPLAYGDFYSTCWYLMKRS